MNLFQRLKRKSLYRLEIKREAQKAIRKLPKAYIKGILEKLYSLQESPRPLGAKKLIGGTNTYRVQKGNYRILYTIDDRRKLIVIYRVSHRKQAYRDLWFLKIR